MKSTGLFGKNSGRIGGVVYSDYRGQQVVRTYQPQVKNPNTKAQISQRAKFKLVSQLAASLGREIAMSFMPDVPKESPRNSFVRAMLKKTTFSEDTAKLPIEEIVLTNSRLQGIASVTAFPTNVTGFVTKLFSDTAKVRAVFVGYAEGGEVVYLANSEVATTDSEDSNGLRTFSIPVPGIPSKFKNAHVLIYCYEPDKSSGSIYEDYQVTSGDATLDEISQEYAGKIIFSETSNVLIPDRV